ncbi:endonuclease domain-containing 1 protein-like [Eublepharis macularius]|uniref:Endonuclease domain-containing 1 protein-like n=1 Tax=Eublepharis macularius TaxID=481883 RepID=A0AA97JR93_EUBMA|nr:endonuclease domain-containing 1 protein-like [Eublepharis macularius]XP_054843834.1 endonuclease domain-containing 1 protein-like [Eublepharis macularius]XP_054843835.1 endonuclease domain-containing 1 protein-like [Eublepharis macularius]
MMLLVLLFISACWHNTPGNAEVVTSFEETCPQFFFKETPPGIGLEPTHPARICQRYKNQYRYATLYNKDKRIPVYSAYIYNPGTAKRPNNWMVEPQLVDLSLQPEMTSEGALLQKSRATQAELWNSQAILKDYKNLTNYNRGHLNPNSHQPDLDAKKSTFTLTNIVPQFIKLNGGTWNNYEQQTMMSNTQGCKETFALVGAVPGNNYIARGRVNKPSHLWSAACCFIDNNHIRSWAIIATNDKDVVEQLTLGQLEEKLAELYNRNGISLFHSDCPRE